MKTTPSLKDWPHLGFGAWRSHKRVILLLTNAQDMEGHGFTDVEIDDYSNVARFRANSNREEDQDNLEFEPTAGRAFKADDNIDNNDGHSVASPAENSIDKGTQQGDGKSDESQDVEMTDLDQKSEMPTTSVQKGPNPNNIAKISNSKFNELKRRFEEGQEVQGQTKKTIKEETKAPKKERSSAKRMKLNLTVVGD